MIELEAVSVAHLESVQTYASDPRIAATSTVLSPYPDDGAVRWFDAVSTRVATGRSRVFAIAKAGEFRGVVSLNEIDPATASANIDYWIAVPFQRQGIATRAVELAILQAGSTLGTRMFLSNCLASNVGSISVLVRNGFKEYEQVNIPSGKFANRKLLRFQLSTVATPL